MSAPSGALPAGRGRGLAHVCVRVYTHDHPHVDGATGQLALLSDVAAKLKKQRLVGMEENDGHGRGERDGSDGERYRPYDLELRCDACCDVGHDVPLQIAMYATMQISMYTTNAN